MLEYVCAIIFYFSSYYHYKSQENKAKAKQENDENKVYKAN